MIFDIKKLWNFRILKFWCFGMLELGFKLFEIYQFFLLIDFEFVSLYYRIWIRKFECANVWMILNFATFEYWKLWFLEFLTFNWIIWEFIHFFYAIWEFQVFKLLKNVKEFSNFEIFKFKILEILKFKNDARKIQIIFKLNHG